MMSGLKENDQAKPAPSTTRFHAMDEARTLAIFTMIFAHWGGSVIERLGLGEGVVNGYQLISRFATPAFVVVFALTVGIVYLHKYRMNEHSRSVVGKKLLGRARLVFWMGLIVAIPSLVILMQSPFGAREIVLAVYGVLMSYSITIALIPTMFYITKAKTVNMMISGVLLWIIGGVVVFKLWRLDPDVGWTEWFRLYLFSGAYAVVPMLAMLMLVTPIGAKYHSLSRSSFRKLLVGIGFSLMLGGILTGVMLGHSEEILRGDSALKAPPTAWFFAMYGGLALLMIVVMDLLPEKGIWGAVRQPFRLLGASSLQVYVAHIFVEPLGNILEPMIGRMLGFGFALLLFAGYIMWVMVRRLRLEQVRREQD